MHSDLGAKCCSSATTILRGCAKNACCELETLKSNEAISNPSQDNTYARDRKDVKTNISEKKAIAVPSGCNSADLKTELDERQSTLPGIAFFSEMSGFTRSFRCLTFIKRCVL